MNVTKNELASTLAGIMEVINGRPLTYLSEDSEDLEPLTPAMFIHPFGTVQFPETEEISADKLRVRYRYVKTLQQELRERWRKEYLAMLVAKPQKSTRDLRVGELVVVRHEHQKRHDWDLARVLQLFPGKDGVSRVAKIRTQDGEYLRPVQRLHPLEMDAETEAEKAAITTRA